MRRVSMKDARVTEMVHDVEGVTMWRASMWSAVTMWRASTTTVSLGRTTERTGSVGQYLGVQPD